MIQNPEDLSAYKRKGLTAHIADIAMTICAGLMIIMSLVTGWQVFGRYILNNTPAWSEQLVGVLLVYMTLIGAAAALFAGAHIALDTLLIALKGRLRRIIEILISAMIALFGGAMIFHGIEMMAIVQAWTIPTLNVSRSINYFAFPVAGALIVLFSVVRLVSLFTPSKDPS